MFQYSARAIKWLFQKSPQHCMVAWYHHYLQHPRTKRHEESIHISTCWKGLHTAVQTHVKKCHSCQVNKHTQHKYGKLPTKLAITKPWEALFVDFIGPYTLKAKNRTQIDFMCITMIDLGSKLQNNMYHSSTSLMSPQVKRGKMAKTHISNQNNCTLTSCQQQ